uniref:Ankyrin repeat and SOCS box containing 8 n=1 Tax=Laticauda laticaudata TaxID=8630 RepID=A0A8C5SAA2_LATLA
MKDSSAPLIELVDHFFLTLLITLKGPSPSSLFFQVNALDGYNRTALHYAAEKDETCVEILLEYGANPNALDGNKDTPLHWAAFKNNAECVRTLLESGAFVNALDYNDDTPLSWAAMKGNLESVSILLEYGAEVRIVNMKGQTPISRLVALLVRGLGTEREDSCFDLLHRATGHFELRKNGTMPREDDGMKKILLEVHSWSSKLPWLIFPRLARKIWQQ